MIFLFLSIIFFVSLQVSDSTPTPSCEETKACNCLDLFSAFHTVHVLIMFFYSVLRVKIGCKGAKVKTTRRVLKTQSRNVDFYFGILFQIFTALMLLGFLLDMERSECHEDARYQKMSHVA